MQFKQVPGATGYEISDTGVVVSYHVRGIGKCLGQEAHELKQLFRKETGYLYVHIRVEGKRRKVPIHELVLRAFVGERPAGMQACHGNDIKLDNRLINLRWGTPLENQQDSIRNGTKSRGEKVATKLNTVRVLEIKRRLAQGDKQGMLATEFGVSFQHISRIAKGSAWAHVYLETGETANDILMADNDFCQ